MNTSSQINVYFDSEVKKAGIRHTTLKPGDTLRLRVQEILGDRRILADFGKFRANAEIAFAVQRGEEFMVKVVETGRQLRFSVLQPALTPGEVANRFSDLINLISNNKFKQIHTDIQKIIDPILDYKKLIQSPEIKNIFLKDVKPNLLLLKELFETKAALQSFADVKDLAKLKAAVDSLLNEINHQQSLAVRKHLHPEPFQVLTFLLPLKENDQHAKIKIYYPKKQKDPAKNGFKISILLNMDAMGEIRTDLLLLNQDLSITFFVKDDANKAAIESRYSEIFAALNHVVEYLVVRTVVSSKKISDFHREDWDLSEEKRVDVRI